MGKRKYYKKKASFDGAPGILNNKSEITSVKRVLDAYSNPPANLGLGANNLSQTAGYIMERFTWDYYTLNILFRNNWIAKAIIEKPANEMLKNGFEIHSELDPDKVTKIMNVYTRTKTNAKFLQCLKWARLYGGCILVPMIEGQDDLSKPLDFDTIMPDSYKGCFVVDRWSGISPSLEIVDEIDDPDFGKPKYYTISTNNTNTSVKIHHSRIIKMIGRELPYWEEMAEDYWGASELEHVYTELRKRDDTSANISFLIFLANIRIFKMKNLGQAITLGDQEGLNRVYQTMQSMNRLMCNTGTFAMDQDDDFTTQQYTFTGINDVYESFMLDISGAAEIPVDKLFGRSPTGFNSGEETLQNYYDTIQEKQETYVREPLERLLKIIIMSTLGEIPDDFELVFSPVRRPSNMEKADLAQKQAQPVLDVYNAGIIGKGTVLRELKQQTPMTGQWSNITDQMIEDADKEDEEAKANAKAENEELENAANKALGGNENGNTEKPKEKKNDEEGN
jgi:phage-related protein (TIGR01555 family)